MTAWTGRITHPAGSITRAWLESPPRAAAVAVVGIECAEHGCCSIIVGTTRAEAERRLAEHARRHGS